MRSWTVLLLVGCSDYNLNGKNDDVTGAPEPDLEECADDYVPQAVPALETCSPYRVESFNPRVAWHGAMGRNSNSLPIVADIDGDGVPEIVVNTINGGLIGGGKGDLWVLHGDSGDELWKTEGADLGFAASPAVGDLDRDGHPEIYVTRAKGGQIFAQESDRFTVVAFDHEGNELWESDEYVRADFDYATGVVLSDMDHDGEAEIVAGRVILRPDGSLRGKGEHGRGAWSGGSGFGTESSYPAVADVDLDGVEEVIVGNARYSPDGDTLWHDPQRLDGMVAVADLDDDPEGEWVVSSYDTVRAHDTDGSILWGPWEIPHANVTAQAAIADIDQDGHPEVVIAGGSHLVVLNHDGSPLWTADVQDMTGGTGASIFDFDGDGIEEVVYIDELTMYAFNGKDGTVKFRSDQHRSDTMMDYPTIADVDADGEAEIVVAHVGYYPPNSVRSAAISVYEEGDGTWAPARALWNQHAYAISQVEDDLTIPQNAPPAFTTHNTWHAATDRSLWDWDGHFDLQPDVIDLCETACSAGVMQLSVTVVNRATAPLDAGVPVTVYGLQDGDVIPLAVLYTTQPIPAGSQGEELAFVLEVDQVTDLDAIRVVVDDTGDGTSTIGECVEDDNDLELAGPFCP